MKRAVILVFITMFTTFPAFTQSEESVEGFLKSVYSEVKNIHSSGTHNYEPLIERYCTRKFREFYSETRRWEEKTGECILHSGGGAYDLFVQCQDYVDDITFEVGNARKRNKKDAYCATVTTHLFGKEYKEKEWSTKRIVYVITENDGWRIADFQSPGETSDLEFMQKILPETIKAHTAGEAARITHRLEGIYKKVAGIANNGQSKTTKVCDKYLTKRFRELKDEIDYWEEKYGEMIVGHDCWVRTQEWDKKEYKVSHVAQTSPCTAFADITATDIIGTKRYSSKTRLSLVLEGDEWHIDDFTDYAADNNTLYNESDSDLFVKGIQEAAERFDSMIDFLE